MIFWLYMLDTLTNTTAARRVLLSTDTETLIPRPERTVADLVETTAEIRADGKLQALCSELQRKIVSPDDKYVGTQYFRLKWVPLLGHLLAWMVVALR